MEVSVCLATYNGEKYIVNQLRSILNELRSTDEIIIVDDCSKDGTVSLINEINDERIKVHINQENKGHVFSFSKSVLISKNDIVFLSDQDDIWVKGRLDIMLKNLLSSGSLLLSSNFNTFNNDVNITNKNNNPLSNDTSKMYSSNIIGLFRGKRDYFGCCMVFRRKLIEVIFPIPSFVESHDWWISITANMMRSNTHINDVTVLRRIHGQNVSQFNRPILKIIKSRLIFLRMIFEIFYRICK
jgi:glycosyltransferase involved in cell wall biosynthesis